MLMLEQHMEGFMKINKEKLETLAALPDNELWAQISKMAKERGFDLPSEAPQRETMEKIRRALTGAERISLAEAARIMQSYKRK